MDYQDGLLVLRKLISRRIAKANEISEWKAKLEFFQNCQASLDNALAILRSLPQSTETAANLEQMQFIQETIRSTEETLNVNIHDLLKNAVRGNRVTESLYLHDALGVIDFSRVSQVPSFPLRGRSYLVDGKKIESAGSLFSLRAIQMISLDEFKTHVAREPWCAVPRFPQDNEWLILNIMIPGTTPVQVVSLFTATAETKDILRNPSLRFDNPENRTRAIQQMQSMPHDKKAIIKLLKSFWLGNQDYCDERCKMIPTIVEGTWAIKMAVGQKPVMLGKKIQQEYHTGRGYLEIDVNLSSSTVATHVLGLVRGVSKDMIVDLGLTIQGESEEELPEVILCQARFDHVDLESATYIPS